MAVLAVGRWHSVACTAEGRAVAVGYRRGGECAVDEWTGIVVVMTGDVHTAANTDRSHIIGLRADGSVATTGWNGHSQCDIDIWSDVITISAG